MCMWRLLRETFLWDFGTYSSLNKLFFSFNFFVLPHLFFLAILHKYVWCLFWILGRHERSVTYNVPFYIILEHRFWCFWYCFFNNFHPLPCQKQRVGRQLVTTRSLEIIKLHWNPYRLKWDKIKLHRSLKSCQ